MRERRATRPNQADDAYWLARRNRAVASFTPAATITVADEVANDTETYPIFTAGATGSQAAYSDAARFKYNASTGALTTTTFNATDETDILQVDAATLVHIGVAGQVADRNE
jgi:hypothetical protein